MADTPPIPQPPRPPQRRSSNYASGIYIVLGVVGSLILMLAISLWVFLHSATGQRIIDTAYQGMDLVKEAASAPGTQALRDRGCSVAMVMSMKRMFDLIGQIAPQAKEEISREKLPGDGTIVMCQLPTAESAQPGCPDVARIYGRAVPDAPARFGVVVQRPGARNTLCQGTYDKDGTFVEPFDSRRDRVPGKPEAPATKDAPIERETPVSQ